MNPSDDATRLRQRMFAVLLGAVYALAFLLLLESFDAATQSPDVKVVAIPFFVLGALEVMAFGAVRGMARRQLLVAHDIWLLVLSAVVIDTALLAYLVTSLGGQLQQWGELVLGAALFCVPAYFACKAPSVDVRHDGSRERPPA